MARGADAGSDHQLAFVNALTSSVLAERHTTILRALLDGDIDGQQLSGLAVDTDLRWRLVVALAAAGAIDSDGEDTPFIDDEASRDNTAAGARMAAAARASRPQLAVKESVRKRVVEDDSVPNTTARAIIGAFSEPGQGDLLDSFVDRYFDDIEEVWKRRSSEVAQTVVIGLYPSWSVTDDSVAKADTFLERDLPPALRRLVIEGRAGVVRALAAREADAQ